MSYTDTATQLIINDISNVDISTITFNPNELYLTPDNAVYSVNNVTPVNGNVTLSIPSEVTETTVSGWGFTKNVGTVTSVNNVSPVNGNVSLTIPTVDQTYDATSANAQSGVAIAGAKFLKNKSTNTAGTSYIIGGTASGVSNAVCVGSSASTSAYSVVVGQGASSTALYSTAIGSTADSNSQFGTAIGYAAKARATSAIQLGTGTNTDSNTFSIGFSDAATNYQLLDGTTGLIPDARLNNLKFDGQWVGVTATLCQGRTSETGNDKPFDVSAYLPSDSNNYEVLLTGAVTTGTTSGNQARINLKSSIISDIIVICNAQTRTSSSVTAYGSCTLAVGTDREVIVHGWSNNTGAYSLYLRGYRRIGTNS